MSTCPVGFVCKNWKYIALAAGAVVGTKLILKNCGCCAKKKPSPCGNAKCACGPSCKCSDKCECASSAAPAADAAKTADTTDATTATTTTKASTRPLDAVVFSGPSGVGKGTLIKKIRDMYPNKFAFSVSHTTRPSREGEIDGTHYHFVKKEDMEKMIENGEFLEACNVHGNLYGTSKKALQTVSDSGKIAIIEMDVQGAQKLKEHQGDLNFYYIFISADEEELMKRLKGRGTDDEGRIKVRLATAQAEMQFIKENPTFYDQVIVNDELEATAAKIISLLSAQGTNFSKL